MDKGAIRTQFHHVIDIVPTILEATRIKAPQLGDGIKQKPIEGVSMAYTFDKANAAKASTRTTQYFEIMGNRGIYHDGWMASTPPPHGPWILGVPMPDVNSYKWELYNIKDDYSQFNDLAAKRPDKLKHMQAVFMQEAKKFEVLPLDNSTSVRFITPRPSPIAGQTVFTYSGEMSGIPINFGPQIMNRSYTITAEVDIPQGGGDGMIVTSGGLSGGYGLYLLKDKPVFDYNLLMMGQFRAEGQQALSPGKHTVVFDFTYDGPGPGKGGTGVLKVDGTEVATMKMPHSIPFVWPFYESLDIGLDTRTPVNEKDYQVPFRFNGTIDKLTFKLGPDQLMPAERAAMQKARATARD